MTNYLIKYLINNSEINHAYFIDLLKHELDWQIYDYGDHMKKGLRRGKLFRKNEFIENLYYYLKCIKKQNINNKKILSYIPYGLDEIIKDIGFDPYTNIFSIRKTANILKSNRLVYYRYKLNKIIRIHNFNQIISYDIDFIQKLYKYIKDLIISYDFDSIFTLTDQQFISRLSINIFNELNKKSFIFSHGLPSIYSIDVDNKSDYLLVWGKQIKQNYINAGFNKEKIVVIGSPKFKIIPIKKDIIWNIDNIIVFPESSVLWHQHTYNEPKLIDRSRIIIYLYEVQSVLIKLGIKKAKFRVHPSINYKWVEKFIDNNFYTSDNGSLNNTLKSASLIIGATSTTFLESIMKGINYIVYERKSLKDLYPPFNGEDSRIPFANTPEELLEILSKKKTVDFSVLNDYLENFNSKKLSEVIYG